MMIDARISAAFMPSGHLRAAINLNCSLITKCDEFGEPFGVSVDLATAFSQRLGADLDLVVVEGAVKSVEAVLTDRADIGFFVTDPKHASGIALTDAYVLFDRTDWASTSCSPRSLDEATPYPLPENASAGYARDFFSPSDLEDRQIRGLPTLRHAMGVSRGRGDAAARVLADFVEEMKANGFIADSLKRHRIPGASVAPTVEG